jgi:hypothetical protein
MAGRITVGSVWARAISTLYTLAGTRHDLRLTVLPKARTFPGQSIGIRRW